MVLCGLICWYSVSWFRSSKKKVTHDKLHALDTTKNNRFIHSKNGAFFLSILYFCMKEICSMLMKCLALHSHDPIFLFTQKRLSKKASRLHSMCVPQRSNRKKEMKMFAFSTWRDHLVVNFSHWLKNGIRGIIYQGEIALNIKAYSTFFYPLFRCVWEFFFRKIQRQAFYSRFEALKLKNKINLSEYIHRHTNCIWSLSIHLLSI